MINLLLVYYLKTETLGISTWRQNTIKKEIVYMTTTLHYITIIMEEFKFFFNGLLWILQIIPP